MMKRVDFNHDIIQSVKQWQDELDRGAGVEKLIDRVMASEKLHNLDKLRDELDGGGVDVKKVKHNNGSGFYCKNIEN